MGEADETENSEDSDTTDGETTKEGDVTEDDQNTDQPSADDESDEEQDVTDESEAGSDEELTDENKPADEAAVSDEDDEVDKINVNGNVINAVTPTSITIDVKQYEKDGTTGTDGTKSDRELTNGDAAEVTFVDGTNADDTKALGGDRPVKFRVDMKEGWKTAGLKVEASVAPAEGNATFTVLNASNDEYTIPTNVAATTGENATPAGYSGNITIKITAVPVKSTVKLSAAAGQDQTVCLVKADGTLDTEKTITDAAGQDLTYAASTADVTLAVSGLAKKYNTISVAANSSDEASTIKASGTKTVGTGDEAKTYYLFTFNPSELEGFENNDDNEVAVTLEEGEEAHGLTLALDSGRTGKWAAAAVTPAASTTEEYITINGGGDAFDVTGITGGLNEDNYAKVSDAADAKKRVLAFKVTPGDALKLKGDKPVKAVLTANADTSDPKTAVQTLDATAVPESAAGARDGYYKIDLSTLTKTNFTGAMTLTVMVETEVDTTATGVHTISFDGDLKNVTLGMKNDENAFEDLDSSYTAKMNDITFGVAPKKGYSLANGTNYNNGGNSGDKVVTVSYNKVYALKTTDTESKDVTVTIPVTGEKLTVTKDGDEYFAANFKFKDSDNYTDAAWKGELPSGTTADKINVGDDNSEGNMEYTKENVVVKVKTELASGKTGFVTIDSGDADYEVSGDGIIKSIGDSYRISEEATLLTLTITSDVEPSVTFDEDNNGRAEVKAGEAEGTYVAEIPVSELAVNDEDAIEDTIVISKGTNTLTVNSTLDGEEDTFGGKIQINDGELSIYENPLNLTSGMKANVTIEAPVGTELVSVAKVVGDDGEEEAVEVGDDKGSVTFPVTMTDDVTVNVALKSVYAATVTVGNEQIEEQDGVYTIPAGSENIKVSLFNGDATKAGNAANILYAKVYDGNEIAVTKATVATNVATIAKIDEKDTGVLRVDLAATATKKVVASVQIKQEKAADKLIVKDAKNKAVTIVSLMADGPAAEFTVSAESGRLEYAESNIGVEVVAKADDAPAASPVDNNEFVTAAYNKGKLTITAKPAKVGETAAAVIRLYDKAKRAAATGDDDKICLMASAITVNTTNPSVVGQKPTIKEANGSEKDKKLWVELSTTDKVVEPASDNKVFYKVTIEGTLAGTLTDADKTQYIEKNAWGKNSQIAGIVVDNTPDANGQRVEGSAKDYTLKVELVQTTAQTAALTGDALVTAVKAEETAKTLALGGQVAELKKISTRNPLYETKLKMKPASVTVYTQQTLDKVAKPQTQAQFDKKTGYTVVPYVQFVDTKTGVLLGEASNEADDGNASVEDDDGNTIWEATVDANGNIKIGYAGWSTAAKYQPKNMGLKVTAEYPEGAYAATAIVKITVANGIENIDFVSGDSRSVYKKSGSPASLKLTPILNGGSKDQAPKKKTLTFAMGDAEGDLPGDGGYDLNPEVAARVKVNPKNGAVTVDRNYDVNKGDTFTVVAKAADYEGNTVRREVYVDITNQAQELGEVVVVEANGQNSYKVVARDGGTLNAEDFFTYYNNRVLSQNLYVRALKPTAGTKRVYTDGDFVWGVTYASSVKAALGVDTAWGELDFIKPNAKAVKLTITPADGSGTKGKKDMNVTVKGFEKLGLEMYDSNGTHYDARYGTEDNPHTYDGTMNEKFELIPVAEMWDDFYKDCWGLGYSNLTVTMRGAKATQKYNGIPTEIVMTAPTATVTIADKTDKTVKRTYTITQDPAADTKAKAPSIKQIGKLTAADVTKAQEEGGVEVKFQVTNKNANPVNHVRQYVFLTPDYTKTKSVNDWVEWDRARSYFLNENNTVIKQIDDNGRFALDLDYLYGAETFDIVPGSYTLIATVGNYSDGKFVPAAKGVNVKINIPGKAAKNNLTVKGKYTLDASAMAPVDLASGNNIVTDYHWTLTNAAVNGNYAMNKIDPKTGKANKFTDYFEVKNVGGSFTLGLKPNLTKAQIDYITGQVKETAKDAKADCEGYVTVSSYMYDDDNHEITKDMKITVSFKDAKYVAKTAEASVYTGAEATVQIFETAKSTDPIALAGAFIVADDKNGGATFADTTSTSNVTEGTKLKVKLGSADPGKSYKVTLKVLAADSAYANMTAEGAKDYKKLAEDYGRTVTATIKVSGKDDKTKNKVAVTGKAFKITADDFTTAQANTYTLDIPVRSAIEGTQITAAAVPATVKDKDYEGKDIVSAAYAAQTGKLTLTVKRDKLIEANAAKGGKFKFGKAVDVPVTFTFTDTAVAAETVNLKVTLPNPMTFEKAVEAATKLEDVIGEMNDDLLFADESDMKADLEERINAAINSAIPKDAQATVSREITLESIEATDTTPAGYKTKVTVWKGAAKADGDYEHEYTFTKAEALDATVSSLVSAIEGLSESALAQLGNDYTPAKLLADVKAALAEDDVKIPANLSLSVVGWNLKKATAATAGNLSVAIYVRDRKNVAPIYDEEGEWTEAVAVKSNLTIEALGTLTDAKNAVADAVAAKSGNTGIDYTTVIYNALKDAT